MKTTRLAIFLASALPLASLTGAAAATNSLPQLHIASAASTEVVLSWPGSAAEFVLEETPQLSALSPWLPVASEPVLSGQDYTVNLSSAAHARFFRLRYQPSAFRSTRPAISFALVAPDGTNVVAGHPVAVEVRASFNALLAAGAVRVSASGSPEAMLTGRSVPAPINGLLFVSARSQQPFESGLPVNLGGEGSLEVLLGTGTWPFDGMQPGEEVVLERLDITPQTGGELSLSLAAVEAVTSRWARDGVRFDTVNLDPWRSTVTLNVQAPAKTAGLGTLANMTATTPGAGVRSQNKTGVFRLQTQAVAKIAPNADGQGGVDLADLVYVRARLGLDPAMPENAGADVNRDQQIDLLDLVAVRNRFTPAAGFDEWPTPRLTEVAPNPMAGEAPWVELSYPQWVEPYSHLLELRNGAQDVLLGSWPDSVSRWVPRIVIVFDGEQPIEYLGAPEAPTAARFHLPRPQRAFNPTNDQCLLYLQGELVDSVSWGDQPERKATLNTALFPIPLGGSIGRDGLEGERWVRFAQVTPGADNGLPTPLAMSPFEGAGMLKADTTRFTWVDPRYSPVAYELEIDDAADFQTPLVRATCYEPGYTHSPGLVPGHYFWRLRAQAGEMAGPWSTSASFEVMELPLLPPQTRVTAQSVLPRPNALQALPSTYVIPWFEQNRVLGPRKDTTMVCLECEWETGSHAWDKPHGTPQEVQANTVGLCLHELGHAATAVAATLNHFYGGDLTQDELNLAVFANAAGQPEGDLGHGARSELYQTLPAALGSYDYDSPSNDDWYPHDGYYERLREGIRRGTPAVMQITVKQGQFGGMHLGPVVIYGYLQGKDVNGADITRLIAAGPFIGQGVVIAQDSLRSSPFHYWPGTKGKGVTAEKSDSDLRRDTDGDGLCDLDELNRFATDEGKADSDGDGIKDKTEVWSYKFGKGWVPRTPDPDGDGERAETDPDTDGDGCLDGAEDRNHDGKLISPIQHVYVGDYGSIPLGGAADKNETDPFWVDEFKVALTAEQKTVRFGECTRLEVKVTDKDGAPVKDAEVRFRMDPVIATYGTAGGTPITYVALLTDKDGQASTDLCAQETEGSVTVEARYKPCPQGKESKAELKIQILPYDWIFAVQEKAVLTHLVRTNSYAVGGRFPHEGLGIQSISKDSGFQKVSGSFRHPKAQNPGTYIESVRVSSALTALLRINGTNVNGLQWTRTSDADLPTHWEVQVASPGLQDLPRHLFVTTRGGPERKTPLLWWSWCEITGKRQRWYQGDYYVAWDHAIHTYSFYFGDGDTYGHDPHDSMWPKPNPTWPQVEHSGVSFVPVVGIPGYALGARKQSGDPQVTSGEKGVYEWIANFYQKRDIYWSPASPWTRRFIGDLPSDQRPNIEAELKNAGPLSLSTFLTDIGFKRDYLGDELKELEQRKLNPPQYQIRMLTGE
jgi:hypothetical protein